MSDTQWPRYHVFVQEKPEAPYEDAGTVHAPDPELALLNGRDVFVRRPACHSLWVAPAAAIFSRTAEQLAEELPAEGQPAGEASAERYYVFTKLKPAGTMTLAGEVQATSPEAALRQAVQQLAAGKPAPLMWWIVPASRVSASDPALAESFFAPALDKPYRLSKDFKTVTAMRQIMSRQEQDAAGVEPHD